MGWTRPDDEAVTHPHPLQGSFANTKEPPEPSGDDLAWTLALKGMPIIKDLFMFKYITLCTVPRVARRWHWIPWKVVMSCRFWESNLGPLQAPCVHYS